MKYTIEADTLSGVEDALSDVLGLAESFSASAKITPQERKRLNDADKILATPRKEMRAHAKRVPA